MVQQEIKHEALEWVLEKLSAKKATATSAVKVVKAPEPPKPLAVAPADKKKELASKKVKELELWHNWNENGRKPKDLDPLLKSMQPLIDNRSRVFKNNVEIPTAAIDFEHKRLAVEAIQRYNPDKGAALGTWVQKYLHKSSRFIQTNQNFARIPEQIAMKIGKFNATRAELTERLGHEPDAKMLAEETGFSLKEIKRLNKDQRKGLISSGNTALEVNPAAHLSSREQEVINLIYHQLTPEERVVHEYTFGLYGKPALKPGDIAKKLKMDNSKVAKLRSSIYKKMQPHLE